jgi:nitroreductase
MDFNDVVKGRRSVRKFTDHVVTDEQLNEALESLRYTPSWANSQCWEFIAIRDQEIMKTLAEESYPKNPATKCSMTASLILVACYDKTKSGFYKGHSFNDVGTWGMFDLGMACQTLSLKLHEMGLGSVVVGAYDSQKAKEILNIGGDFEIAAIMPVGEPATETPMPKRKDVSEFLHIDKLK